MTCLDGRVVQGEFKEGKLSGGTGSKEFRYAMFGCGV
jgi:hypothetical protein